MKNLPKKCTWSINNSKMRDNPSKIVNPLMNMKLTQVPSNLFIKIFRCSLIMRYHQKRIQVLKMQKRHSRKYHTDRQILYLITKHKKSAIFLIIKNRSIQISMSLPTNNKSSFLFQISMLQRLNKLRIINITINI